MLRLQCIGDTVEAARGLMNLECRHIMTDIKDIRIDFRLMPRFVLHAIFRQLLPSMATDRTFVEGRFHTATSVHECNTTKGIPVVDNIGTMTSLQSGVVLVDIGDNIFNCNRLTRIRSAYRLLQEKENRFVQVKMTNSITRKSCREEKQNQKRPSRLSGNVAGL